MMDMNSFEQNILTYGGDLSRWPREMLTAAAQTLKTHPQAQILLDEAVALDQRLQEAFAASPVITPSAQLRTRLLAVPDKMTLPGPLAWLGIPKHLAAGLALFLVLGIFMGSTNTILTPDDSAGTTEWILAPDQITDF